MLPYGHQLISEGDIDSVVKVLRSDWLTTGPTIARFERALSDRIGAAHVVAVNSGTAALHAAYAAAGICAGDEVIMPALTFAATANAAVYLGAQPVFAEVDPHTFMLDPDAADAAVGPRTRAIVVVHYAGAAGPLAEFRDMVARRGIVLIEDAAHAFGATADEGPVGAHSTLAAFSFHPVKIITTGEGGAIATDDSKRAAAMRAFRNHGISTESRQRELAHTWHYEMVSLGFNYRLTDIGAALGLSQLDAVNGFLAARRAIAKRYVAAFARESAILTQSCDPDRSAWHFFPIALAGDRLSVDRDDFVRALRMEGIGANVHYDPVHLHPFYRERFGHRTGDLPVTESTASRLITLPLHPNMDERDVDDVIRAVCRIIEWYRL
jgi:perosamine synthetase